MENDDSIEVEYPDGTRGYFNRPRIHLVPNPALDGLRAIAAWQNMVRGMMAKGFIEADEFETALRHSPSEWGFRPGELATDPHDPVYGD
jgi:hypothetical protein